MATLVCVQLPAIPPNLTLSFPGVGELNFLKEQLTGIPRMSDSVLKMLNNISPALSPIYTIIKILDVLIALFNCINAIPKSLPFNPEPIIDCIKKLVKAVAGIASLMPPIVYVRMIGDLAAAVGMILKDFFDIIAMIDLQITYTKSVIAQAIANDDPVLLSIGECSKEDIAPSAAGMMQILEVLGKLLNLFMIILDIMASVLPGPIGDQITKVKQDITGASETVASSSVSAGDFPKLEPMLYSITLMYSITMFVENLCKGLVGATVTLQPPVLPTLSNS